MVERLEVSAEIFYRGKQGHGWLDMQANCVHSRQDVFKEGRSRPCYTHEGVVPILPQARIRVDAKGKLPKTPRSMHCTVSRTRLGIKETEKFQDAGRRAGCRGLQFASGPPLSPDSRVPAQRGPPGTLSCWAGGAR